MLKMLSRYPSYSAASSLWILSVFFLQRFAAYLDCVIASIAVRLHRICGLLLWSPSSEIVSQEDAGAFLLKIHQKKTE
jgi:hypothetical protein